jgi:hypothetical protein
MKQNNDLVWYAAYGSNINMNRFLCYIRGGTPKGLDKIYNGAKDKTLPQRNTKIIIPAEIYFANSSSTWQNGGVAFLKNLSCNSAETLGRIYLITKEQFVDVLRQETHRDEIALDFDRAIHENYVFIERSWYGRILFLGEQDGHPIFTFTNERDLQPNKPSQAYLKTIVEGLKDLFNLSNDEIVCYFLEKTGVSTNYQRFELEQLVKSLY